MKKIIFKIIFIVLFCLYFQTYATGLNQNNNIKEIGEKIELPKEQISKKQNNFENTVQKSEKEKKIELIETNTKSTKILEEEKVEKIKIQIEENNKNLENKINNILEDKVKEKISKIKKNEKYNKLDIKVKNDIFLNYIKNIDLKISDIKKSEISKSQKDLKINILNTLKLLIEKEIIN